MISDRLFWIILRAVREARGMSQTAAAAEIGIRQPNLSELESGRVAVSEDTMIKVATAYGMTLRKLLSEGLRLTEERP